MFPSIPDQDIATSILLPLIIAVIPFLILSIQFVSSVFYNMNLILLVRPFCLIHLPLGTKPEFIQLLQTPVPVHGFGPFLVILWAYPYPHRSLYVHFDTGLVSLSFLVLLQFAADVVELSINLVIIYWVVDMDSCV